MVNNAFLLRMGLEIFFLPTGKQSGLLDALLTLNPEGFQRIVLTLKNLEVSILPNTTNEETRDELQNSIEDGILKGVVMLIFYGVCDAIETSIHSFANTCYVGLELVSNMTMIEDILHGFFMVSAKRTL